MGDGAALLTPQIECDTFLNCLNNLHPDIEYMLEAARRTVIDGKSVHVLNFLDITVILHNDGSIETDTLQTDKFAQIFKLRELSSYILQGQYTLCSC